MKKYSVEEAKDLRPLKKGKYTWLYKALMQLKVGEAIGIDNNEWKGTKPPYRVIRRAEKNLKFKFDYGRNPDKSGWLVKRLS